MISNNEIISEIDEVLLYFSGRKTWVFNTLELQLYYVHYRHAYFINLKPFLCSSRFW